jgi:diguanylate cyclase (GGDEF)-like protein
MSPFHLPIKEMISQFRTASMSQRAGVIMRLRFIRSLNTELGKIAILVVCIAIPVLGGMLACNFLLMRMLREEAQATSNAWVSMLVARNPDLLALFSDAPPNPQMKHILEEATQVGDIYRFRIWDTAGNLIYKSERLKSIGSPIVFSQKRTANAVASGTIVNEVHEGGPPQNVPFFVESFVPVKRNGVVIGVVDVFLDQSDDKILYQKSLLFTEGIIVVLVILAAGLPGYLVYHQMRAISHARADAQFRSEHDTLTGLINRHRLNDVAKNALAWSRRNHQQVAALMIDLDRFKEINDTFGHAAGDEVLKAVATRLEASIREEDSVARFGGDEFVVLQVGIEQPSGARFLAERLIVVLSEPFDVRGRALTSGASIGVAIVPQDAQDFETLIACADVALYKSKAACPNSISFFEPGMDAKVRERHQLETDIRLALTTGSFQLAYQPLLSLKNNRLLGFEALLRWPEGWSPQSPLAFIPVMEESGTIDAVGEWVLETACRTAASWTSPLRIAVNLSPVQFRHGNLVSVVENALKSSGLDPHRLELEVTESVWIQDTDSVLDQLTRLRRLGVSIALDDFGTGYSSLSYLWKFPFDIVKIDRSFVSEMETEPKAAAIVNTIMALGKTLGVTITAEGVETAAQAKFLKKAGCDQAQGFLLGRPLTAAAANSLANADLSAPSESPLSTLQAVS